MPVHTYTVACTRKALVAPAVYELAFTKPEGFQFKSGQYVLFDVPLTENPMDLQTRAYSIASSPSEGELLFVLKITPGGRMSRWVEERCQPGASITMKAVFGMLVLDRTTPKRYLFIATGTGIAPFRSQLKWLLEEVGDTRPMDLIFGVRVKEDLFWTEEFKSLSDRFSNLAVHLSLTSGEPDWHGHAGRVQDIASQIISDFSSVSLYVCGAPEMVKSVKTLATGEWGILKQDIHAEGYI